MLYIAINDKHAAIANLQAEIDAGSSPAPPSQAPAPAPAPASSPVPTEAASSVPTLAKREGLNIVIAFMSCTVSTS